MAQGGRGKKTCNFPPEGDTVGNAITRKCKLGMLTYITMDISLCPPEWYQSAKFRVLAHALTRKDLEKDWSSIHFHPGHPQPKTPLVISENEWSN